MKKLRIALIALIIGSLGVRQGYFEGISLPVATPSVTVEAPSQELQDIVAPIREAIAGTPKAAELASFYAAFSDVVGRDQGAVFSNSLVLEKAHRSALILYGFQSGPMVGEKIDDAIAFYLGIEKDGDGYVPQPIDPSRLAEVLLAISWASA